MQYRDCGALLIVDYLRLGKRCKLQLTDRERELYLYCTKMRARKKILEKFSAQMGGKGNRCLSGKMALRMHTVPGRREILVAGPGCQSAFCGKAYSKNSL